MIKYLKYDVTFPTTGRRLKNEISFDKGFTAIVGPNESGKSFVIEMIRFCLFGTAALRGVASDYKTLTAEMVFKVKGETYKVVRKINSAKLFRGDKEIAAGVRPVNRKIIQIMGFGLDVFDVACVANQGDIEKLGTMKPAERKRMVDNVIGLNIIDDLVQWANSEVASCKVMIEGIRKTAREPAKPEKPADYRPSAEVMAEIEEVKHLAVEYHQLQGQLAEERHPPEKPKETVSLPSANLLSLVEAERERRARINSLKAQLRDFPEPSPYTKEELDKMEALHDQMVRWKERENFLRLHSEPPISREEIEDYLSTWDTISEWERREKLIKTKERLERDQIQCPECLAKFPLDYETVERINDQIEEMEGLPDERPENPPFSEKLLNAYLEQWDDWENHLNIWEQLKDVTKPPQPPLSRDEILKARRALAAVDEREKILNEIKALEAKVPEVDLEKMYRERLAYEQALSRYLQDHEDYVVWLQDRRKKELRFEELKGIPEKLAHLQDLHGRCLAYEYAYQSYLKDKRTYDEAVEEMESLEAEIEDWKKVKAALTHLRTLVKQHLVPSVNKVASYLINSMTGGQRQSIVVDEDFNVEVDGQDLNTLSGSGKAVANLALRLALGRVLTNGVFSVFVGDEIDASMDLDRAENTTKTLRKLVDHISQILLVTHKYPAAEHIVAMGNEDEIEYTA